MARGNDAAAARRDLDSQYGADNQHAEDLIRAHDDSLDPVRQAAQHKAIDALATEEFNPGSIKPRNGGEIVSYAIRGGVLFVTEEAHGTLIKWHDADAVKSGSAARGHARQGARGEGVAEAQPEQKKTPAAVHEPPTVPPVEPAAPSETGGAPAQVAPEGVKVAQIRDKLDTLRIQVASDVRKKDELWGLLPGSAQDELVTEADQSPAEPGSGDGSEQS